MGSTPIRSWHHRSDAGQLASVKNGGTTEASFGYDSQGNRTSCTSRSGTYNCAGTTGTTYTFDAANRLSQENDNNGGVDTFEYDGNGLLQYQQEQVQGFSPSRPPPSAHRATARRHRVRRHLTAYDFYNYLTWNTALGGVPTLAL